MTQIINSDEWLNELFGKRGMMQEQLKQAIRAHVAQHYTPNAIVEQRCIEARKAVLEDISQRINYDDYSGLEVSKAWKKLCYHVEGSLGAVKRQELAALKGKEE